MEIIYIICTVLYCIYIYILIDIRTIYAYIYMYTIYEYTYLHTVVDRITANMLNLAGDLLSITVLF